MFVPKKEWSPRFCVGVYQLNVASVRDFYSNPRTDEFFNFLGKAKLSSTVNASLEYRQIQMNKKYVDDCAFATHIGLYKYTKTRLLMKKTPAMFCGAMDVTLAITKWHYAVFYIANIIMLEKKPTEHLQHNEKVLKLLNTAEMTIKLKMCSLVGETIDELDHIITTGRQEVAGKTMKAWKTLQYPNKVSQLRSFPRLCNVYRFLVPSFAKLAAQLN